VRSAISRRETHSHRFGKWPSRSLHIAAISMAFRLLASANDDLSGDAVVSATMPSPPGHLMLLHGFGSTFDHSWVQSGWVDILADFDCSVPIIDLPGHGSSIRSTDPADYGSVEEDVAELLPEPTSAVGFSAGAQILLRIAVTDPSRFDRLVLLGVGDNVFDESDNSSLVEALESGAQPENVQARVFTRLAATTGNDPTALAAFLRQKPPRLTPGDLAAVTCPVLVVLGEEDFVPSADRLVEALPSATLVSAPGVGHFATASDFGVIDATMRFLDLG
jgi:pimeloyl-ACP methyl ester carboxylesterase